MLQTTTIATTQTNTSQPQGALTPAPVPPAGRPTPEDQVQACYVYGLCLPLRTYLLADKWLVVRKRLRTSLGSPLCILFRFLLTY